MGFTYFPSPYPDELFYSLICRYYAHSGYPNYNMVLEEVLKSKTARVDMEFFGKLNDSTKDFLESQYGMDCLIWEHTMFPQYVAFENNEKLLQAIAVIKSGEGDIHNAVTIPVRNQGDRFLRYCPCCAMEDRKKYGETYWHRNHQLRLINVCTKHMCRLRLTDIEVTAKKSPRLWIAEEVIPQEEKESDVVSSEIELKLAEYVLWMFQRGEKDKNVPISDFLISRLEGTKYITKRGKKKFVRVLFEDMMMNYKDVPCLGITEYHQLQKVFTGYKRDMFSICQIALFLGINIDELAHPVLPEMSQIERFDSMAENLRNSGKGCHRAARELGCCPTTALRSNRQKKNKEHDYGVRKGIQRQDWVAIDLEMETVVRAKCEDIYRGASNNGRPGRVTVFSITKALDWPDKRLDYLPKCKSIVEEYAENQGEYWAREIVWAYQKLKNEKGEGLCWTDLRRVTNLRREAIQVLDPYLDRYANESTVEIIRKLF